MSAVIEQCIESKCNKIKNGECVAYLWPEKKWRLGRCPLAPKPIVEQKKKFVNPLKASKKKAKKK